MRVIGGFEAHDGTRVRVKVSDVGDDVLTFAGVLKRFDDDGGGVDEKWSSDELEHGVMAKLGDAHGYDLIILPVSKTGSDPKMTVSVTADDASYSDQQTQNVGDNVPFGWRIFID
jgi:hypothetical protein